MMIPNRVPHMIWLIDRSKWVAIRSFPPLIKATIMKVIDIAPNAVRFGALRGRSSRWCSRLSPVIQLSMNGYRAIPVNKIPGMIKPGIKMFHEIV